MRNNPWDYLEEENSKQQEQKSTRERLYLACVGQPRGWSGSGGVNESLLGMKTQTWRGPDPVGRCRASSDWTGRAGSHWRVLSRGVTRKYRSGNPDGNQWWFDEEEFGFS